MMRYTMVYDTRDQIVIFTKGYFYLVFFVQISFSLILAFSTINDRLVVDNEMFSFTFGLYCRYKVFH